MLANNAMVEVAAVEKFSEYDEIYHLITQNIKT